MTLDSLFTVSTRLLKTIGYPLTIVLRSILVLLVKILRLLPELIQNERDSFRFSCAKWQIRSYEFFYKKVRKYHSSLLGYYKGKKPAEHRRLSSKWSLQSTIHRVDFSPFRKYFPVTLRQILQSVFLVISRLFRFWQERFLRTAVFSFIPTTIRPKGKTIGIIYGYCIWFSLLLFVFSAGLHGYTLVFYDLPDPHSLKERQPHLTTKLYDRHGTLLYKMYKDENRTLVQLSELPQSIIDATVAIEDQDFFEHRGVSLRGMLRALRSNFSGDTLQGGSTITQQLIKNTLLSRERTYTRKIKEVILALQVERIYTKEQILQMYFNEVSYGGSIYGIEEAARAYFGVSSGGLSLAQSAFLAGLPAAPSLYNPFGSYPEHGRARQKDVLRRLVEESRISSAEYEMALKTPLVFQEQRTDILAPHFVMYIRELLAKEYGEDVLSQGGLHITTTLDLPLQEKVQKIVRTEVDRLRSLRVGNGAALVTNPKTGEILAMVGSRDYFDQKNDGQVNVTLRIRQPGSSIKPLAYAAAFERGYTPATPIDDTPISISIPGSAPYVPQNYDGRFHGKVPIRTALASSYNIPAVKTLMGIGVIPFIEKARTFGISTWEDASRYGLSIALGGGDVKMIDLATAYSTFPNLGVTVPLQGIQEIRLSDGRVIFQNPCVETVRPCGGRSTLDPRIAYQITSILSDPIARAPAFGTQSVLSVPGQEVAVKTGTTNGLRDNWTIGYTQDVLIAVWVGNNDNSPMSRITSGIVGASPIWRSILNTRLQKDVSHRFPVPQDLRALQICRSTGGIACAQCKDRITEYFLPGTEPTDGCGVIPDEQKETAKRDQILEGMQF